MCSSDLLVLLKDGRAKLVLFVSGELLPLLLQLVFLDLDEHAGRLFAAHDGDAAVGPRKQEARLVGAAAHAVVAGAEGAADEHGEFGDVGGGDGLHHLGAILGDAAGLVLLADHEAGDVLQEQQRHLALVAQLDEVRRFDRTLREQDPVVGDDADGDAVDVRKDRKSTRLNPVTRSSRMPSSA